MSDLSPTDLKNLRIVVREAMERAEAEGRPGEMSRLSGLLGTLEQRDPDHYMREELDIREVLAMGTGHRPAS